VITATENYGTMAEDLEGGNLRYQYIAEGGTNTTNAEKAWHFYFGGLNSGFMYYGKAEDMEVKPSLTGNIAIDFAQRVINANPGIDRTAPAVFIPQRFPYNPGSSGFGPITGYKKVNYASDFHVWTYAYDVSGLNSVNLKYRIDADGTLPVGFSHNKVYAGGSDVGTWESIEMTRQPMAADPTTDSQLNFFIQPTAKADLCFAEIKGFKDKLIDYFVEAVDSKGNIFRTPIQHVYVGAGDSGGTVNPNPNPNPITVKFKKPTEWGGSGVNIWAWNDNGNLFNSWPGQAMTDLGNGWYSYSFDQTIWKINVIFSKNGSPQTVDIMDVAQSTCYQAAGLSGSKLTVTAVDCAPTDIENIQSKLKIAVYPQPVNERFVMELPNIADKGAFELTVTDLNAKVLMQRTFSGHRLVVERGNLTSGLYILKVVSQTTGQSFSTKLSLK